MSRNIAVAIKTLEELKAIIESKEVKKLLDRVSGLEKSLERFEDINHLIETLQEVEGLIYIGKEFLTLGEAAKYMGVSMSKVYKMTSSGKLTPYRLSTKMVFVLRDEVNDFIRSCRELSDEEIARQAEYEAERYILRSRRDMNVKDDEEEDDENRRKKKGGRKND